MDIKFRNEYIPGRYKDRLMRGCTLYPLEHNTNDISKVVDMTLKLQQTWRARLHSLQERKLTVIQNSKNYQFKRNCLPSFGYWLPRSRTCGMVDICPFCYSRDVLRVWNIIDNAFLPGLVADAEDAGPEYAEPAMLVEEDRLSRRFRALDLEPDVAAIKPIEHSKYDLVTRVRRVLHKDDGTSIGDILAARMKSRTQYMRSWMMKDIDPVGAYFQILVEPYKDEGWMFTNRLLMMVRPNTVLPQALHEGTRIKVRHVKNPTRKQLYNVVSGFMTYPIYIMRGNVERTVQFLEARKRHKLSAMYGRLRTSHIPE